MGDALLYALEGLPPPAEAEDEGPCILDEELAFVLSRAQCPVSREEVSWLARTFRLRGGDDPGYLGWRLAGGPLANFALGARDNLVAFRSFY